MYSIFPNPAYDQILIKNLSGLASVVIYDDKGNLIYNCRAMGSTLIPVSHWKAGIYFICIQEVDGKATMHKIVVARN
ncbi:MAG: T9SS type A sorting domain-containing protein [Saprospiraceae bacterium]|nr:T9SS type A sorting domain-containing protein [Saprospiraceae bacterium]